MVAMLSPAQSRCHPQRNNSLIRSAETTLLFVAQEHPSSQNNENLYLKWNSPVSVRPAVGSVDYSHQGYSRNTFVGRHERGTPPM